MIHQYKNNGYNIVLDVNSGSVHVVDEIVYDVIPLLERISADEVMRELAGKYGKDELSEAIAEVISLKEAGQLYTEDTYKEYVLDFKRRKTVVKALCLHIAHDCNLACRYCFAEEGEYHGKRALMSLEVGKKALDFLIAHSGNRRNLEVDFFGGEPLMNWEVVKELVLYGRSKEAEHNKLFRFTLTTNGMLLNEEVMNFCNKEMSNVVLSLDGRKEVNDRMRPSRNGKSSYDVIVPKFQKFVESRKQARYYVRGTFTRHNLDFAQDVLHYADLGFTQLSMEPVVAAPEEEYAIRKEDIPAICEEYDRLAVEYIKRQKEGRGFQFFHFMIDLEQGPCVAKRLSGCGSGTEYLRLHRGVISILVISLSGRRNFFWEMWRMGLQIRRFVMNLSCVMCMQRKSAGSVLHGFTVVEDVRQIPTNSMVLSQTLMILAVSWKGNEWNVRL